MSLEVQKTKSPKPANLKKGNVGIWVINGICYVNSSFFLFANLQKENIFIVSVENNGRINKQFVDIDWDQMQCRILCDKTS